MRKQVGYWKFNSEGLRHLRKVRKLSLQKISNLLTAKCKIKISRQTLCDIEKDKITYPNSIVLAGLSVIFGESHLFPTPEIGINKFTWFIKNERH